MSTHILVVLAVVIGAPCTMAVDPLVPYFYNVSYILPTTSPYETINGWINMCLQCIADTNTVTFHWGRALSPSLSTLSAANFVVTKQANLNPGTVSTVIAISTVTPDYAKNTITLNPSPSTFLIGEYINVTVSFSAAILTNNTGWSRIDYKNSDNSSSVIIQSQNWPAYGKNTMPCLDGPSYTAGMNITIHRPATWKAVTSLPLKSSVPGVISGTIIDTFNWTQSIAMPLVKICISSDMVITPYTQPTVSSTVLNFWSPKEYTGNELTRSMNFFANYFYQFESALVTTFDVAGPLSIVLVPNLPYPMSGFGIVFIRNDTYADDYSSPYNEGVFKSAVLPALEEIMLQRTQYITNFNTWSDSWMGRAFARYMLYAVLNSLGSPYGFLSELTQIDRQKALSLEMDSTTLALADSTLDTINPAALEANLNSISFRIKGSVILSMLDLTYPAGAIRTSILNFLQTYKWQSPTSADWYTLLSTIVTKSGAYTSQSMIAALNNVNLWFAKKTCPLVKVDNIRVGGPGMVDSILVPFLDSNTLPPELLVSVIVTSKSDRSQNAPRQDRWVNSTTVANLPVTLATGDWVVVTKPGGYWRANYTEANWLAIRNAIAQNEVVSRSGNKDDAFALANNGMLSFNLALKLATANMKEALYKDWFPVLQNLFSIGDKFRGLPPYKCYQDFMEPFMRNMSSMLVSGKMDEYEQARLTALAYPGLCEFNVGSYRANAVKNFELLRNGQFPTTVPTSTYEPTVCCAAKYSTNVDEKALWSIVSSSSYGFYTRHYNAIALGCLPNYKAVSSLFDTMLANKDSQHLKTIFSTLAEEHPANLAANMTAIAPKLQGQIGPAAVVSIIKKVGNRLNTNEQASVLSGLASADVDDAVKAAATSTTSDVGTRVSWIMKYNVTICDALQSNRVGPVTPSSATTATLLTALLVPIFLVMLAAL